MKTFKIRQQCRCFTCVDNMILHSIVRAWLFKIIIRYYNIELIKSIYWYNNHINIICLMESNSFNNLNLGLKYLMVSLYSVIDNKIACNTALKFVSGIQSRIKIITIVIAMKKYRVVAKVYQQEILLKVPLHVFFLFNLKIFRFLHTSLTLT